MTGPHPEASGPVGLRRELRFCMFNKFSGETEVAHLGTTLPVSPHEGTSHNRRKTAGEWIWEDKQRVERKGVAGSHVRSASFEASIFSPMKRARSMASLQAHSVISTLDTRLQNLMPCSLGDHRGFITGEAVPLAADHPVVESGLLSVGWIVWGSLTYVFSLFFLLDVTLFGKGHKHFNFSTLFPYRGKELFTPSDKLSSKVRRPHLICVKSGIMVIVLNISGECTEWAKVHLVYTDFAFEITVGCFACKIPFSRAHLLKPKDTDCPPGHWWSCMRETRMCSEGLHISSRVIESRMFAVTQMIDRHGWKGLEHSHLSLIPPFVFIWFFKRHFLNSYAMAG